VRRGWSFSTASVRAKSSRETFGGTAGDRNDAHRAERRLLLNSINPNVLIVGIFAVAGLIVVGVIASNGGQITNFNLGRDRVVVEATYPGNVDIKPTKSPCYIAGHVYDLADNNQVPGITVGYYGIAGVFNPIVTTDKNGYFSFWCSRIGSPLFPKLAVRSSDWGKCWYKTEQSVNTISTQSSVNISIDMNYMNEYVSSHTC
jgi:hypothetical protein